MKRFFGLLLAIGMATSTTLADQAAEREAARRANLDTVMEAFKRDSATHKDNPDVLVRPGLIANRVERLVTVAVEGTGLSSGPAEFFVIGAESGHDYEAVTVALARPSDIREALEFIGVPVGRPAIAEAMSFVPKGERVFAHFRYVDATGEERFEPVEKSILDTSTGISLPVLGFVFTGSHTVTLKDGSEPVLACDVVDPRAIITAYNERNALLDVPRQARQREVYPVQMAHPAYALPANALASLLLSPERREDGGRRVFDGTLAIASRPETENDSGPDSLAFTLTRLPDGAAVTEPGVGYRELTVELERLRDRDRRDVFVVVAPAPELTVARLHGAALLLGALDTEGLLRIEAPPAGEVYYMAYRPNPEHRDRAKRFAQPWELLLDQGTGQAALVRIEQDWEGDSITPTLRSTTYPVKSGDEVRSTLDAVGPGLSALLIFATPETTHGHILSFVRPVLSTHPFVHVFVDEAPMKRADAPPGSIETPTETDALLDPARQ